MHRIVLVLISTCMLACSPADGTVIGRVGNGDRFTFQTALHDSYTFEAQTESKSTVSINIEKGQEYFVRCGIVAGVAIGRPAMEVVENRIGVVEWEALD